MQHFDKIRAALGENDAMLITSAPNRFYASGFESSAGVAIVTKEENYFFTDFRYIEAAEKAIDGAKVVGINQFKGYMASIKDVIKKHDIKKLGFEEESVSYAAYKSYESELGVELCPNQMAVTMQRASKTPEEFEIMKQAQAIAEKSFNQLLNVINTNMTERDVATELHYLMMKNGSQDKSFDTIVVSAEKSSMPHGVPGDVKLKKGFLTIDFGVKYKGYCSDTTRTLCIGTPTDEMKKIYNIVLEAQKRGIETAKAGVICSDVDKAGRDYIKAAGYGDYFGHGFGHSLGIEIHEYPRAAESFDVPLPEGAVISAEPGIYLPGKFGVRIEDVLYITKDGNIDITNLTRDMIVL